MIDSTNLRISVLFASAITVAVISTEQLAAEETVSFDIPATVAAFQPADDGFVTSEPGLVPIIVDIPVSVRVASEKRSQILEVTIEIQWYRNRHRIVDYSPKSTSVTDIAGTIAVEKHKETSTSAGIEAGGTFDKIANASTHLTAGRKNGDTLRFERVPEHRVAVATGTINRGTGVTFKFHPTAQAPIEGERYLQIVALVPEYWRTGVLQVSCSAQGRKKVLPGVTDSYLAAREKFVLPIYRLGDTSARQSAIELASADLRFRDLIETAEQSEQQFHVKLLKPIRWALGETDVSRIGDLAFEEQVTKYERITRKMPKHERSVVHAFLTARNAHLKSKRTRAK